MMTIIKQIAGAVLVLVGVGCSSMRCCETVKDIDGNVYKTVRIGDQVWMKENLRTTRYQDGTPIAYVSDATEWRHTDQPAYAWPEQDQSTEKIYGALYNWHTVSRPELCPPGWRVPTDEDFKQLELYLGMTSAETEGSGTRGTDQGGKLKKSGLDLWDEPNKGATNETGFSAVPAGRRWCNGIFQSTGIGVTFWTTTESSLTSAVYRHLNRKSAGVGRNPEGDKKFGYSVRFVRDD